MATFLSGVSLSALRFSSAAADVGRPSAAATALPQRTLLFATGGRPAKRTASLTAARSAPYTPEGLPKKVSESIKNAEEACGENTNSGECAAAWDEVEELSAAASHAAIASRRTPILSRPTAMIIRRPRRVPHVRQLRSGVLLLGVAGE
ncbi:hypothetical protein KSP40_PGU017815 [Platanthera guangdongensis]|uniref:CP12 domain-containing protein n=1 Tax=Platanthera guangdongensis TaxID=2320717 RepID=A0ABR2LFS6_9ASPA